jgi:hypothetical protein
MNKEQGGEQMDIPVEAAMEQIEECIANAIERCQSRGMRFPLLLVAIGVNGALFSARYTERTEGDGLDVEMMAEHSVEPGIQLPINIMIVDPTGEAARVLIGSAGTMTFH